MFYSTEEHICVATADSPLGPFKQDEHKPIREEKSIDTSVFFDEDGKAYLYFVRFNDGNVIRVRRAEREPERDQGRNIDTMFQGRRTVGIGSSQSSGRSFRL
ncbi:family 43 glycosylhydrolase [Parabacteroides merdae]|nr:family 43 glycosylhydrolase [Parabacteroides merdae]